MSELSTVVASEPLPGPLVAPPSDLASAPDLSGGGAVAGAGPGLAAGFRAAALSGSTRAAYQGDWARFQGWCAQVGVVALPARPASVAEYVAQAAGLVGESGRFAYAPATLSRWVAAVNAAHRAAGQHAPGDDPGVAATLRGIRATRRQPRRRAKPVSLDQLRIVLAAINRTEWPAGVIGARDTAMLLLGFAGALRRSELAALTLADVELADGALTLRIRSSKTDQEAEGQSVGYPRGTRPRTCAACAVLTWAGILRADTTGGRVGVLRLLHQTRLAAAERAWHACTDPDRL